MAHLDIDYLDYLVSAPDAADNSFGVHAPLPEGTNEHPFVIEVKSGNVQFCVGQPVGPDSPIHPAGDKLVMSNINRRTIYYKAGSPGDSFIVGF